LKIIGYQFPDNEDGEDSNWLMVYLAVSLPQGAWSVTDPFLLTYEVKRLADWLDAVDTQTQAENEIAFLEPNLLFEVTNPTGRERYLRVYFDLECLPPWAARDGSETEDIFADFPCEILDLHVAAEALRFQLSHYTQRAVD